MAKFRTLKGESKRKARGGLAAEAMSDQEKVDKVKAKADEKEAKAKANREAKEAKAKAKQEAKANKAAARAAKKNGASKRVKIMDNSVCGVLFKLGKDGVSVAHAREIMKAQGVDVSESTVSTHIFLGRAGKRDDRMAKLTKAQVEELKTSAPEPEATAVAA